CRKRTASWSRSAPRRAPRGWRGSLVHELPGLPGGVARGTRLLTQRPSYERRATILRLHRPALRHIRHDAMTEASIDNVAVGLVQMSCSDDPGANLRKAVQRIGDAARQGAQIVCLQELFRSQYFCQTEDARLFDLAEPIPGPSTDALGRAAAA